MAPNTIRVRVLRAFRIAVPGVGLEPVNPGDVVDLPRNLAVDAITANKAELADGAALAVNKNYVPEYAKRATAAPGGGDVAALVEAVREQNALIAQLIAAQAGDKGKSKAA